MGSSFFNSKASIFLIAGGRHWGNEASCLGFRAYGLVCRVLVLQSVSSRLFEKWPSAILNLITLLIGGRHWGNEALCLEFMACFLKAACVER